MGGLVRHRRGLPFRLRDHFRKRKNMRRSLLRAAVLLFVGMSDFSVASAQTNDPLPSWNNGAAKQKITEFVRRVTTPGTSDFVPPAERIATFDNDGTLWSEQPMYVQLAFVLDRVKAMAAQHPE